MTLPASGAISFNAINVELGVAGTTQASLGQTSFRNLAGVASGQISMSNFYGKANQFAFTISSNQTNANLRTLAVNAGWNQSSKVVATIGSGVYVSSSSTGTPALTVNGSFPGGVELINNGFIVGMGGNGGTGGASPYRADATAGSAGGLALSVSSALTVNNQGTIGGGGGGGGGGAAAFYVYSSDKNGSYYDNIGGGGGGGGRSGASANSSGGAGGNTVGAGASLSSNGNAGGSGLVSGAGSGGASRTGGGGGYSGAGGAGGDRGAAGSGGNNNPWTSGSAKAGGSGGSAVSGNGNITWAATGTRLGAIA